MTEDVCSVCYLKDNLVDKVELMRHPEVVGKNILHLFRCHFDINVQCPTKKWRGNIQKNQEQKKIAAGNTCCGKRAEGPENNLNLVLMYCKLCFRVLVNIICMLRATHFFV